MPRESYAPHLLDLRSVLESKTMDQLKQLIALLPDADTRGRKADLVATLEQCFAGGRLHSLWSRLDDMQQAAVADALYSVDGLFDADRFRARYGCLPKFTNKKTADRYAPSKPTGLRLFLHGHDNYEERPGGFIPVDLSVRLREFVPKPRPLEVVGLEDLPETYERLDKSYRWQEGDEGVRVITRSGQFRMPRQKPEVITTTVGISVRRRDTERDAVAEVMTVLRLIDRGKLSVSDKTCLPGTAALRELGPLLSQGDFYLPEARRSETGEEIGVIKALAWPLLMQAGGLAELSGKKLVLTKTGREALGQAPTKVLQSLWSRWLKTTQFDEFQRISLVKGQAGKGKSKMTSPAGRRAVIKDALKQCPVGVWVELQAFSRYMQATDRYFSVTRDPWSLYIYDTQYGNLGYDGFHDWNILQQRYLTSLLMEYAATLGLIDMGYIDPWETAKDYTQLWGVDDADFFSRYDGLIYFRINPLGAWFLGMADDYQPVQAAPGCRLRLLPSLQISVVSGDVSPEESLFLDIWAENLGERSWRLDAVRILDAIEQGRPLSELREFLDAREDQGLPDTVEGFLVKLEKQANAMRLTGLFLHIDCADEALADQIAGHKDTKSLCLRAGPSRLAIKPENEDRFRRAVRKLGWGLPRA